MVVGDTLHKIIAWNIARLGIGSISGYGSKVTNFHGIDREMLHTTHITHGSQILKLVT